MRPLQRNVFFDRGIFRAQIGTIHVPDVELTFRNRQFHTLFVIYSFFTHSVIQLISSCISIKWLIVYNFTVTIKFTNVTVIVYQGSDIRRAL